jgi:hypothetical protein
MATFEAISAVLLKTHFFLPGCLIVLVGAIFLTFRRIVLLSTQESQHAARLRQYNLSKRRQLYVLTQRPNTTTRYAAQLPRSTEQQTTRAVRDKSK